jgi:hypothetical protein
MLSEILGEFLKKSLARMCLAFLLEVLVESLKLKRLYEADLRNYMSNYESRFEQLRTDLNNDEHAFYVVVF